ncbi:glycosyltransferase family 2 protein [bacterium]|nr:glycosyltransferase family 2 protein [bacterium]
METLNGNKNNAHHPMISVVMPNYNGIRFVEDALKSVLNQTYKNLELIVVDDCSTDNSPDIIEKFAQNDGRIKLFRQKNNSGVAAARNTAVQMAAGKYTALIDNDDIWEPDKLERQLALAENGADIVYSSYDFTDENGKSVKRPFIVPEEATFRSMLTSNFIGCSTAFVRSDLMKSHPFNADYYHEDYVLWMELLKLPVKAVGDKKVLMHYRLVAGSRSNKKANAAKERWNTYRKALGLNVFQSALAFAGYAVKGLLKYYF